MKFINLDGLSRPKSSTLAAARGDWYRITSEAATPTEADLYLYDVIGWDVTASSFAADLDALSASTLNLFINSPGGDVFDGVAILNLLRRYKARNKAVVNVWVDGIAASAASFIAMAGDRITMGAGTQMMIHDSSGMCWGNAADMRDTAELLDRVSDTIASIYAGRAGGDITDWRERMRAETWYDADEAVEAGLADQVDKARAGVENSFDLSVFAYAGRDKAPAPRLIEAHKLPAEPAESNPNQKKGTDMSDALIAGLRDRLGLTAPVEDITDEMALAAIDEALNEQANPTPQASAALPDGVVAIDATVLENLRADAAAGRQASDQLVLDRRQGAVNQALKDGRITASTKDQWLAALATNEAPTLALLNALAPVVNTDPHGYTGGVEESSDDDLYNSLYLPQKEA